MEAIYVNNVGNIITFRPCSTIMNMFIRVSSHTQDYTYTKDQATTYLLYWNYELIGYV